MNGSNLRRLRHGLKLILTHAGLLTKIQSFLTKKVRRDPLEAVHGQRFLQFKQQYGHVLRHRLNRNGQKGKIALVSSPPFPEVEIELGLIKALELAGFVPIVLIPRGGRLLYKYYRLAAVKNIFLWSEFLESPHPDLAAATAVVNRFQSIEQLLTFEYAGARVGRLAVSSALRRSKRGTLDLQSAQDRNILIHSVAESMAYASAAQALLRRFRPHLAILLDVVYTPEGELFDNCIVHGVDTIIWQGAHKSNSLMLKRYTSRNRGEHPCSLSSESWRLVRDMHWNHTARQRLHEEIHGNYANGDWYSIAGTQFNKQLLEPAAVRARLQLDPTRKTAFIFPNIPWDASLFWVECLFQTYDDWFIETVRAACANDRLNWIIKIHPANVGKRVREGYQEGIAELATLQTRIGNLPPHVSIIAAETDISTYSLFPLMDYCLTVCGTVGLEAARLGIPVLTGGRGLYSHKGFTIDSASREEYIGRLAHIQHIARPSPEQHELAERFAYGIFVLRPLRIMTATLEYHKSQEQFSTSGHINIKNKEDWYKANDLRAFATWASDSTQLDFLMPLAECWNSVLS